ncbi:MAG: trypsin-like serine protease [Planctomycetaceae bacterium]|jgi:hypothetical protein|nr:trypsin-like serine protease [Planctomycetaceae bacterium]
MKRERKRISFEVLEDRITLSAAPIDTGMALGFLPNDELSQTATVSNALASIEVIPVKVENAGTIGESKPTPDTDIEVGEEYYLEIWATDLSTAADPSGGAIVIGVAIGIDTDLVKYMSHRTNIDTNLISFGSPSKTLSEGYISFQLGGFDPYTGVLNADGACLARIRVQAIAPSDSITFDVMQDTSNDNTILLYAQANNYEVIDDSLITIIPAVVQQTGDPLFVPSSTQTENTETVSSDRVSEPEVNQPIAKEPVVTEPVVNEPEVTETESVIAEPENGVPLQEEITWTEHVTPEDLGDIYVPDGVDRESFLANLAEFRSKIIYTQTSSGKIVKTIPAEALQLLNEIDESKLYLTSVDTPAIISEVQTISSRPELTEADIAEIRSKITYTQTPDGRTVGYASVEDSQETSKFLTLGHFFTSPGNTEDLEDIYVPEGVEREIYLADLAELRNSATWTQTTNGEMIPYISDLGEELLNNFLIKYTGDSFVNCIASTDNSELTEAVWDEIRSKTTLIQTPSGKKIQNVTGEALQLLNKYIDAKLCISSVDTPSNHVASSDQYTGVVKVNAGNNNGYGTGSLLLSGEHVLTAAHIVLDNNGNLIPAGNLSVTFNLPTGTQTRYVDEIYVADGFILDANFAEGVDLAIIHLTQPAPDAAERYDIYRGTAEDLNAVVTKVGYGRYGTGSNGANYNGGTTKRFGQNTYDITFNDNYLVADFDDGTFARDTLGRGWGEFHTGLGNNEVCIASGDSGGPGFITTEQGQIVIAGVSIQGGTLNPPYDNNNILDSSFGELFCDLRITNFKEWIDSIAPPPSEITLVFRDYSSQIVNIEVADLNTLADQLTFIDEWSNFQVEIWGNTHSSIGISEYTVALNFPPNVFDVRHVSPAAAFNTSHFGYTSANGTVTVTGKLVSGSEQRGDNVHTLLARVEIMPAANGTGIAVPLYDHGAMIQPNDNGFSVKTVDSSIKLTSGQTNIPVKGFIQNAAPLYAVMFDSNDDGIINVNDFFDFLNAYNKSTTDIGVSVNINLFDYNFDNASIINVNDFFEFLNNYNKLRLDSINNPVSNYITYAATAKNYFASTSISQTANVSSNQQNAQDQAILDYIDDLHQLLSHDLSERVELSESLEFFEEIVI